MKATFRSGRVLPAIAAILLGSMGSSASAGTRQTATITMPEEPAARKSGEDLGYAEAVLVGDTAYLSGVVASVRPGETTPDAAYRRAFERISGALARVGCGWDDIVDITSFHTDVAAQLPFIVAAKKQFVHAPYPAWTAIGVTRLIPGSGITEIKVIAHGCTRGARPR